MRALEIDIFDIWKDGINTPVKYLGIEVAKDNLLNYAIFKWALFQTYSEDAIMNNPVTSGMMPMDGADYVNWNNAVDINLAAFEWVANQLNVKLK